MSQRPNSATTLATIASHERRDETCTEWNAQLRERGFALPGIAGRDRDGRAGPRQAARHAQPEPAVAARDDRNATGEIEGIHGY
jgi:hypothetical protein